MSAGWVAGTVRARAFGRRRAGRTGVRALAAQPSLSEALELLVATPYARDLLPTPTLRSAQHAVASTVLWNVRVLAGWLPREGADALRALAGWFEIANVEELLRQMEGAPAEPPFRLGTLSTAWPQLATAGSPAELRHLLARSAWGDPGGETPWHIQLGMQLAWADRVRAAVEPAADWAAAGALLLLARETIGGRRSLPEPLSPLVGRLLGVAAVTATDLTGLAGSLPASLHWVLADVQEHPGLWAAEARFWRHVEDDAFRLARTWRHGLGPVVGTVALMAVDAWRVRAALGIAARGRAEPEVLDAVG